jgi:hypothetical protein
MHTIHDRLGEFGVTQVTTTVATTGTWNAILCLNSVTVFATLTELGRTQGGTTGSLSFPAGVTIYGAFTNFTLTTGAVRAYKTRDLTANP